MNGVFARRARHSGKPLSLGQPYTQGSRGLPGHFTSDTSSAVAGRWTVGTEWPCTRSIGRASRTSGVWSHPRTGPPSISVSRARAPRSFLGPRLPARDAAWASTLRPSLPAVPAPPQERSTRSPRARCRACRAESHSPGSGHEKQDRPARGKEQQQQQRD